MDHISFSRDLNHTRFCQNNKNITIYLCAKFKAGRCLFELTMCVHAKEGRRAKEDPMTVYKSNAYLGRRQLLTINNSE